MRPRASTTTTASESESRSAVANCSPSALGRLRGCNTMLGGLLIECRQEERGQHRADFGGIGLAIHCGTELGRGRQALGIPAQMLTSHAHAGFLAIVREHPFEVGAHDGVLL